MTQVDEATFEAYVNANTQLTRRKNMEVSPMTIEYLDTTQNPPVVVAYRTMEATPSWFIP